MPKLSTVDVAEMRAMMLQEEEQHMRERAAEDAREAKVLEKILTEWRPVLVVAHTEQQFRRFRNVFFCAMEFRGQEVRERDCVRVFRAEHLCGLDPQRVHLVLLNSWEETAHPDLHHGVQRFMDRGGELLET